MKRCHVLAFAAAALMALCYMVDMANRRKAQIKVEIELESSGNMPFDSPMCVVSTGKCHENPAEPSPRTEFSVRRRDDLFAWEKARENCVRSAANFSRHSKGSRVVPLVLFGDSIFESFLGTKMNRAIPRADGIASVFESFCAANNFDPLVLAISGDQTQNLLWRMQNGEFPSETVSANPEARFMIHIGTNNLGGGFSPDAASAGMVQVVREILDRVRGRVVVLSLLPRGDGLTALRSLCERGVRCRDATGRVPFKSFLPAISKANEMFRSDMKEDFVREHERLRVADCGYIFATKSENDKYSESESLRQSTSRLRANGGALQEVNEALMPDKLHPNGKGHKELLECLRPLLS